MRFNLRNRHDSGFYFNKTVTLIAILIVSYTKTAWADCSLEEWECDDGQCIEEDARCDGIVHCNDGTDEIAEYCIDIPCTATYAFRCTYGACIAGAEKCNGRKGCADGSDEMPLLCRTNDQIKQLEAQQRGNCSDDNSLQCKSGECIDIDNKCDGRIDCPDGTDETIELCSTTYCPSYAFKCGYGGCIRGTSKCDNIEDCPDGSDEAAELCKRPRVKGKRKPTTVTTTTTTTTTRRPSRPPVFVDYCEIPTDQKNLIVTDLEDNVISLGSRIETNAIVKFRCGAQYTLEGDPQSFCSSDNWLVPTCTKYCPKSHLTSRISLFTVCYYQDSQVSCKERIRPDTQARLFCATGFIAPPVHRGITQRKYLSCQADGTWDYEPNSCNMECGRVVPKIQEFSIGGNKVNITEVPWHVGIYFIQEGAPPKHICGGTIITPNLVVSAAHCFWDSANEKTYNPSFFVVVAGKYYRDYNRNDEPYTPQKRNITEINVPWSFRGPAENYKDDIAVLKLATHLKFTESIRPACVEFFERSEREIPNELTGNFAGWGITVNQRPSELLQSVSMQTLSYRECAKKLKALHRDYTLPNDKFCLFDEYGRTACRGDSGGGFVIRQIDGNKKEYYSLIGIVSHGASQGDCAQNGLVVMTNVQWFDDLINKHRYASESEF